MGAKKLPQLKATGKKLPLLLTMRDLRENVIAWSDDTVRRKIESEGFPGKQEEPGGAWVFNTQEVLDWFKRRYGISL